METGMSKKIIPCGKNPCIPSLPLNDFLNLKDRAWMKIAINLLIQPLKGQSSEILI
jgi:hypothetical protein